MASADSGDSLLISLATSLCPCQALYFVLKRVSKLSGINFLYWVAQANMFLASWSNLLVVLPMALVETLVASYIASKLYLRKSS